MDWKRTASGTGGTPARPSGIPARPVRRLPRARRRSRPFLAAALGVAAGLALAPALHAQQAHNEIRLGYLLSRAAGFSTADRAGAEMGLEEVNRQAQALDKRFTLVFDTGGLSDEVVQKAERMIDAQHVQALLGSVSPAATVKLAKLADARGIVFFNIGSDADSLRGDNCHRNAFSIGPSLSMRVRALGQWAIQAKHWAKWAIVRGDSRDEGRLADAAKVYLAANGGTVVGEVPVGEAESHDPTQALAALKGMPEDFVFIALTGEKQELFLDAYQKAAIATPVGGAEPEVARIGRYTQRYTGYWSTGWSHQNTIFGASELNNRFADYAGLPMTERSWGAWAGVKVLGEAILRAKSPAASDLVPYLRENMQFDGYMGDAMNFRPWNHQLRQKMSIVAVNHDPKWNGWDALTHEAGVPLRRLKGWKGDPLDSIGFTEAESGCKF